QCGRGRRCRFQIADCRMDERAEWGRWMVVVDDEGLKMAEGTDKGGFAYVGTSKPQCRRSFASATVWAKHPPPGGRRQLSRRGSPGILPACRPATRRESPLGGIAPLGAPARKRACLAPAFGCDGRGGPFRGACAR